MMPYVHCDRACTSLVWAWCLPIHLFIRVVVLPSYGC